MANFYPTTQTFRDLIQVGNVWKVHVYRSYQSIYHAWDVVKSWNFKNCLECLYTSHSPIPCLLSIHALKNPGRSNIWKKWLLIWTPLNMFINLWKNHPNRRCGIFGGTHLADSLFSSRATSTFSRLCYFLNFKCPPCISAFTDGMEGA